MTAHVISLNQFAYIRQPTANYLSQYCQISEKTADSIAIYDGFGTYSSALVKRNK